MQTHHYRHGDTLMENQEADQLLEKVRVYDEMFWKHFIVPAEVYLHMAIVNFDRVMTINHLITTIDQELENRSSKHLRDTLAQAIAHGGKTLIPIPPDEYSKIHLLGLNLSARQVKTVLIQMFFHYSRIIFDNLSNAGFEGLSATNKERERVFSLTQGKGTDFAGQKERAFNYLKLHHKKKNAALILWINTAQWFLDTDNNHMFQYIRDFDNRTKHESDVPVIQRNGLLGSTPETIFFGFTKMTTQQALVFQKSQQAMVKYLHSRISDFIDAFIDDLNRNNPIGNRVNGFSGFQVDSTRKVDGKPQCSAIVKIDARQNDIPEKLWVLDIPTRESLSGKEELINISQNHPEYFDEIIVDTGKSQQQYWLMREEKGKKEKDLEAATPIEQLLVYQHIDSTQINYIGYWNHPPKKEDDDEQ
ncbi:hypothetical protein [Bifidobacterium porcinum]|uniref:hypothetical protein n=1 Tax=Bifidobacterium porcinum TaxID=212365 RepID=UPI003995383F